MSEILMVNPPYINKTTGLKKVVSIHPPLGLAYLAASLEKEGLAVQILDANAEFLTIEETANKIASNDAEYVGITAVTVTIQIVYSLSKAIKERCNKKIIVGGPHVTFLPERTLKECSAIDIIIRGEGENTIIELLKSKNLEKITGITYRSMDDKIISNPDRPLIENIDEIPFPARHLLPVDTYRPNIYFNKGYKGRKYARIITSRGCPNRCVFCSSAHFWKKLRLRSPENVISEIESLVTNYDIKHLDFLDDTMTLSRERIKKICTLMKERGLDIDWTCYARVNNITEDIISLMKESGCFGIAFGVESGNQEVLNRIQKNITLEQVRKAIKVTKNAGIKTMCDFMIGLPGDTVETIDQTINFAIELNPDLAFFSITTPFPGTALFNEAMSRGWINENYSWDEMTLHGMTKFRNEDINSKYLAEIYPKALKKFYLRPGYISNVFKRIILNPYEFKNYFMGARYLRDL